MEPPADAVGPGATISKQTPPPFSDQYVLVQVSNIINPDLFDVQLIGKETSESLEELMAIMQSTYNHELGSAYAMPKSLVKVGQLCAAKYSGTDEWHRCFITEFKEHQVQVCFFDYGTIEYTSSPLRLLRFKLLVNGIKASEIGKLVLSLCQGNTVRARYTGLPMQAIRSRLAHVKPANRGWSAEACQFFADLVTGKKLFAIVTHKYQDVIYVSLTDTSGPSDIHITDVMMEKGYASFIPDVYKAPIPTVTYYPDKVCSTSSSMERQLSPSLPSSSMAGQTHSIDRTPPNISPVIRVEPIVIDVCFVRYVKLTNSFGFHLIRVDEKVYVTSSEVSLLLWDEDLVTTKLQERGYKHLSKLFLLPEEHADVFEMLKRYPIPGVVKRGKFAAVLVLFELSCVALILEIFGHPSDELKAAVQLQISTFNPRHSCWRSPDNSTSAEKECYRMDQKCNERKSQTKWMDRARSQYAGLMVGEQVKTVKSLCNESGGPVVESGRPHHNYSDVCVDSNDEKDHVCLKRFSGNSGVSIVKNDMNSSVASIPRVTPTISVVPPLSRPSNASQQLEPLLRPSHASQPLEPLFRPSNTSQRLDSLDTIRTGSAHTSFVETSASSERLPMTNTCGNVSNRDKRMLSHTFTTLANNTYIDRSYDDELVAQLHRLLLTKSRPLSYSGCVEGNHLDTGSMLSIGPRQSLPMLPSSSLGASSLFSVVSPFTYYSGLSLYPDSLVINTSPESCITNGRLQMAGLSHQASNLAMLGAFNNVHMGNSWF